MKKVTFLATARLRIKVMVRIIVKVVHQARVQNECEGPECSW